MDTNFLEYRPARIIKGKNSFYVAYSVVNPETDKLTVKRIKLNHIHSAKQRKEYAEELECSTRILREKWQKIRKKLKFSDTYQFYSLKDSGITKMINILNVSEVRDQARHSSIAITDVYTDRSKIDGNEHIKSLDFTPRI